MKLVRFGPRGREKPGVMDDAGVRRDCAEHFRDWDAEFFRGGGIDRLRALVAERGDRLPRVPDETRWGSCVARPGKLVCIGLNYRDHAAEAGMPVPAEPVVFQKASNTVVGPYDPILIPRGSRKTDWEVELGFVVARDARYLTSRAEAWAHIAGYCISHDVSEREFQLERGGQWTKGKSADNFSPIGPWLLTADEMSDVSDVRLTLAVNGRPKQDGSTRTMIFDCGFILHYLSQFMTMEAGDVVSTGTPPGVGMGQKPEPQYLRAGDVVELGIAGLGSQRQVCESA